ncbi:MAG: hypothetical protein ACRDXB_12950 [Actinomycetes bacterium]
MAPPAAQPDGGNSYGYESPAPAAGPAFVVSRDEVLAKYAALLAEADDFRLFLERIRDELLMTPMGGDPVSQDVARAVTDRIRNAQDSYFNVCQQWVDNLYQAAEALAETARQYGYTDEEIAASFNGSAQSA